jgi:malate dehydrogenase (oxaloacetate-decarboxylating)
MAQPSPAYSLVVQVSGDALDAVGPLRRELAGRGFWVGKPRGEESSGAAFVVEAASEESLAGVPGLMRSALGTGLVGVSDRVLEVHRGGLVRVRPARQVSNFKELSQLMALGTRRVSDLITEDPGCVNQFSARANTIAIVSDGTALSDGGDLRPRAALPGLESRAVVLGHLADINGVPLCAEARSVAGLVDALAIVSAGFAGIFLAEIAAPRCFVIQERLTERLGIPVVCDSQEPAAIVVLAALSNALRMVGKRLDLARIVVAGRGAAPRATARLLRAAGAAHLEFCMATGAHCPSALIRGAEVLITSGPACQLDPVVEQLAADAVVFLLDDDPDPGLGGRWADQVAVLAAHAADAVNRLDWAVAYPGVLRGLLDSGAARLTTSMQIEAARAIAALVGALASHRALLPRPDDRGVVGAVADAVQERADEQGPASCTKPVTVRAGR